MSFSIGQMNQLAKKFEEVGWGASLVTKLGQADKETYNKIAGLLELNQSTPFLITVSGIKVFDCGDYYRFTLPPTDGATGEGWVTRLNRNGFRVGSNARELLLSQDFLSTTGVTNEVAVLKSGLFGQKVPLEENVVAEAVRLKLSRPGAETVCLLREEFTDEEIAVMGIHSIVPMHKPISDYRGDLRRFLLGGAGEGRWIDATYGGTGVNWEGAYGFAFVVSPEQSRL